LAASLPKSFSGRYHSKIAERSASSGKTIARVRDLVAVADDLPGATEYLFLLQREHFGVGVERSGNGPSTGEVGVDAQGGERKGHSRGPTDIVRQVLVASRGRSLVIRNVKRPSIGSDAVPGVQ
jgi:hypothetical protein